MLLGVILKPREVSNRVWVFYLPIARLLLQPPYLVLFDSSKDCLAFRRQRRLHRGVGVFAVLLWRILCAESSKALMCLAVALPFAPDCLISAADKRKLCSRLAQFIFPLTVFSYVVLFVAAASCIYMLIHNFVCIKKRGNKMFAGSLASESGVGKNRLSSLLVIKLVLRRLSRNGIFSRWKMLVTRARLT